MDDIQRALDAYNSPRRHNFNLNGKAVSNLEAVQHFLSQALCLAKDTGKADILMTMANINSFQGNIDQAIHSYNQALLSANHHQQIKLNSYLAVWHHFLGKPQLVTAHIEQISHLDPKSAKAITGVITIIENNLDTPILYHHTGSLPISNCSSRHAIVTLGYKLNSDGSIAKPLVLRLKHTLKLATQSPNSLIIVTGGVETAGITEADQMQTWLVEKGVSISRIIKEEKAANTIDNAQLSLEILQRRQIQHATLVSASIHVHRSQILFETIQDSQQQNGYKMPDSHIAFNHLAVDDELSPGRFPSGQTRINCYIDALRGYGLAAFSCGDLRQI
ncbi:ElyC/SanA/YdcF family protein [Photobacterium sp. DNB23_23_1]|uniref:YdcF family protein n=1 Tax=Photobacterium pectinilyticum TaxID=2906793 RepID=A0ABT1N4W0_9GAMM|nr:YdcF family protein [Photobacterium sp. ZSDE20]MCQ1059761.1 YdcF family protein [Photobacterium sp. ZSDE20]MDD1825996.1 YdcF family protein [Photobacterium sp. ZSDE20]